MAHQRKISVIGLGYVGLPVAVEFGLKNKTIAYDINSQRIEELKQNIDKTKEVTSDDLARADIFFTDQIQDLKAADFHIVAVPTPITEGKVPDLNPIIKASEALGGVLKQGDIVVYESTVYPGVCEEVCAPILEAYSKLKCGVDFKIGYSPERINPGDKEHTLKKIIKVVSGQDDESAEIIDSVYSSIVEAGTHRAPSIKVAEAAKVIENIQRDVNIALVNELAMLFNQLDIDTHAVLEAAGTKWNFLKFKPGLVGGHCIGVDPYYLTYKAKMVGFSPDVITSGRRVNDSVGSFVAQQTVKKLISVGAAVKGARVGIFGLTFKENCPDIRNSRSFDIIKELKEYGVDVLAYDPEASEQEVIDAYQIKMSSLKEMKDLDGVVLAVKHSRFKELGVNSFKEMLKASAVIIDVKKMFNEADFSNGDYRYWRL